ncbi:MAG: cytochrome b/b6 domain-containing protein [Planctomycetes bacterium]|nr:cytochrome b/b6 domain-containing protein [Planctomycetota bacterium]
MSETIAQLDDGDGARCTVGRVATAQRVDAAAEWRRPLTGATLGLLIFETLTGLSIYLLPFSRFNEFGVLIHTVLGVLAVVPFGLYLAQHWWRRFRGNFNHFQLLGYFSAAALVFLFASGFVLTWQAFFGVRISYFWDLIHIIFGFVFIAALGTHLVTLLVRRTNNPEIRARLRTAYRSCAAKSAIWCGVPTMLCFILALSYTPIEFDVAFGTNYSFKYGEDRPFAPSLARKDMSEFESRMKKRILAVLGQEHNEWVAKIKPDPHEHVGTVGVAERLCADLNLDPSDRVRLATIFEETRTAFRTHGRIGPRALSGSAGCGTSGCHSEIVAEWLPSAHRYSSMDFVFQKVQSNMAEELAPEATRYCAGCHDPIALLSGAKNVGNVTLSAEGADEGTSCLVCHSIVQADVRGNADYTIDPPQRYIYEFHEGELAKLVSDFLIRTYPRQHVESYSRPLYKTAKVCAACHKQFIDAELNEAGWVQGQNQYDNWRKSRWHTDGEVTQTISCRECHMPLVDSNDPAAGDQHDFNRSPNDGKHRSHRFLAANQFIPRHHDLPGAEGHCQLTVDWLRGEYRISGIEDRWTRGPVVRVDLKVPETARPGQRVRIQTVLINNKTGHDFPTGPLDMIEAWVEVTVRDYEGSIIFASARPDERDYLVDPKIVFKGEPIDKYGNLIGKHELWRKVGSRFNRSLFPGFSDPTEFVFECLALPSGPKRLVVLGDGEESFRLPADVNTFGTASLGHPVVLQVQCALLGPSFWRRRRAAK